MFSVPPLTPVVKKLLIVLGASYVLQLVLQNFLNVPIVRLLMLDPGHLGPLTPLQMLTYVLVPASEPIWMVIELVFLWLILSPFESSFGPRRTLVLTLWGIVGTSIAAVITAQLLPSTAHPYVGASCISLAGIAAVSQLTRGKILMFGVFPLTSQQALLGIVALSVVNFLASKDFLSLVCTLASLGAGLAYVRYLRRPPPRARAKRSSGPRFRVVRGGADERDGDGERPKWLN